MRTRAFTLIEILLVCVMIATLAAVVTPKLGGTSNHLQFEEAVQQLAETIRFGRKEAVNRRLLVTLEFLEEGTKYRLRIQDRQADSNLKTTTFQDSFLDREWNLPHGFKVTETGGTGSSSPAIDLVFRPTGTSDPVILQVGNGDKLNLFIELGPWYDEINVTKVLSDEKTPESVSETTGNS